MNEFIGLISGFLVVASVIPYAMRTHQGKIDPNLTSWSIWALLGLAILLTYKSSGAAANIWPAVFGFLNPVLIMFLLIRRGVSWTEAGVIDKICLFMGVCSIALWVVLHKEDSGLTQYALYVAMVADVCAGIPTLCFVWRNPDKDRPFAWTLFAVGYGVSCFAVTEHTVANYILSLYMFGAGMAIALPLIFHRIRNKCPIRDWV